MILALSIILFFLILIVGGERGAKAFITLIINTIWLLISIFLINQGLNPLLVILIICGLISLTTLVFQNEKNVKTVSAMIAVYIVLLLLIPIIYYVGDFAHISGFSSAQYGITDSNGYSRNIKMNMALLQLSVIFIFLIGAIIDTSIAISSALFEINRHTKLSSKELFKSGMNVGRDILGTTIHTIFYIFIGEYLTLLLQFTHYYSFSKMINSEVFAQEILCVTLGGIGCLIIIPVSCLITVTNIRRKKSK